MAPKSLSAARRKEFFKYLLNLDAKMTRRHDSDTRLISAEAFPMQIASFVSGTNIRPVQTTGLSLL